MYVILSPPIRGIDPSLSDITRCFEAAENMRCRYELELSIISMVRISIFSSITIFKRRLTTSRRTIDPLVSREHLQRSNDEPVDDNFSFPFKVYHNLRANCSSLTLYLS